MTFNTVTEVWERVSNHDLGQKSCWQNASGGLRSDTVMEQNLDSLSWSAFQFLLESLHCMFHKTLAGGVVRGGSHMSYPIV